MKKNSLNKQRVAFILTRYSLHLLLLLFLTITVTSYTIRYFLLAQNNCITQDQINVDSRCLYILNSKVYEMGSRNSPHKGHSCGQDVSSIVPSSHGRNPGNYLLPNYVADFCSGASQPTPTNTPTNTPIPTTPPTSTPTPTKIPVSTPTPTNKPANTPTPTNSPAPTQTPTPTTTGTNTQTTNTATPTPTIVIMRLTSTPTPTVTTRIGSPITSSPTPTLINRISNSAATTPEPTDIITPIIEVPKEQNSFGKLLPKRSADSQFVALNNSNAINSNDTTPMKLQPWEKSQTQGKYLAYLGIGSFLICLIIAGSLIYLRLKRKNIHIQGETPDISLYLNHYYQPFRLKVIANIGITISVVVITIPLIIWLVIEPLSTRFSSNYMTLTSLGEISGLLGIGLFTLSLIYSVRFRFWEKYFGGINVVYKYHHQLGGIGFIVLMIHPLLLAITYAFSSLKSAAFFLLPGVNWPINFGIISLLSLMLLLILTFFIKLKYPLWRFTHKFLGVAFFFGALHSFLVPSDISREPILRVYMFILIGLGLLSYLYKTVLGRFFIKKYPYAVREIKQLNNEITEITLDPINVRMDYHSGQFVFIGFEDSPLGSEIHPFSLSSSPSDNELKLTIKDLGDYTEALKNLTIGTIAKIEGPYGRFFYDDTNYKSQVWIAGGIGITPFISMAKTLTENYQVDLYYAVKDQTEAVYLDELINLIAQKKHLLVVPFYSKDQGRLNAEYIMEKSGDLFHKDIFLCGPPQMMSSLRKQFQKIGIPYNNIHSEEFSFDA